MPVDDWFWEWMDRHTGRFPRSDWPTPDKQFWADLRHEFVTHGVTQAVAEEASRRLYLSPPDFVSDHPGLLLAQCKALWAEARAKRSDAPVDPSRAAEEAFNAEWDRKAAENWAELTEQDREDARALVRERLPELARHPRWLEGLAIGWSFDPTLVAGFPPKRESLPKGVKRVAFVPNPNPRGS